LPCGVAAFLLPALAIQFEKLLPVDTCAWVEGEVFGNHMGGVQVGVRRLGFPHHSLIIVGNKIGLSAYVVYLRCDHCELHLPVSITRQSGEKRVKISHPPPVLSQDGASYGEGRGSKKGPAG